MLLLQRYINSRIYLFSYFVITTFIYLFTYAKLVVTREYLLYLICNSLINSEVNPPFICVLAVRGPFPVNCSYFLFVCHFDLIIILVFLEFVDTYSQIY